MWVGDALSTNQRRCRKFKDMNWASDWAQAGLTENWARVLGFEVLDWVGPGLYHIIFS